MYSKYYKKQILISEYNEKERKAIIVVVKREIA